MKVLYQLYPCLTNGNRRGWQVQSRGADQSYWSTFAWVSSIKAGKALVAHMRRKPIPIE